MTRPLSALALLLLLAGCKTGRCVGSSEPVHGSVSSCCSSAPRYYWTGSRCAQDTACECDATPASPGWASLQACEEANWGCTDKLE